MTPMSPRTLRPYTAFVSPKSVPGLMAWWDASSPTYLFDATSGGSEVAADGAVARWEDRSGSGNHATQSTSGYRPVRKLAVIGGKDAVRFDGTDDGMPFPALTATTFTVVAVGQKWNAATDIAFLIGQDTSYSPYGLSEATAGTFLSTTAVPIRYSSTRALNRSTSFLVSFDSNYGLYVDGAEFALPNASNSAGQVSYFNELGCRRFPPTSGKIFGKLDVGELCFYNRVLSTSERRNVERYLRARWGTP